MQSVPGRQPGRKVAVAGAAKGGAFLSLFAPKGPSQPTEVVNANTAK
jgi:hypothetical protein